MEIWFSEYIKIKFRGRNYMVGESVKEIIGRTWVDQWVNIN